jgi:hypothetical protein
LRAPFVKGDAIFQIGSLPLRNVTQGSGGTKERERLALQLRVSDGMLSDQPGGFCSILTYVRLGWPTLEGNDFLKSCSIPDVNGLHARNVSATKLARI